MATVVRFLKMSEAYVHIVNDVLDWGETHSPRGQETREIRDYTLELLDPTQCWASGVGRNLNPKIGIAEALQLIGGFSYPRRMIQIAPSFEKFTNETGQFHAPYGPRISEQLEHVLRRLRTDPYTRQAVITIWDPTKDSHDGERDYPCTVMLQFLIRNGRLHLSVVMRSNDVYWGLPYDVFQFCQLQATMASILDVPLGSYVHHVVSMHAYERNVDDLKNVRQRMGTGTGMNYTGIKATSLLAARTIAHQLMFGAGNTVTETETWMRDHMKEIDG